VEQTLEEKQLDAQMKLEDKAKRDIERNKVMELEVGDHVRVLLSALYSSVRKQIKQDNQKLIVVKYSPEIYVIKKVIKPRGEKKDFEKHKYILSDLDGNELLTELKVNNPNKERKARRLFATELQKVDKDSEDIISTEIANKLNNMAGSVVRNEIVEERPKTVRKSKSSVENVTEKRPVRVRKSRDILDL